MNKEEYLNQLKKYLKRLPADDYQNAMDYFIEYFEEAGPEGEEDVIKELGTPKEAASELLSALLDEKIQGSFPVPYDDSLSGKQSSEEKNSGRFQYRSGTNLNSDHKTKSSPFSIVMIVILSIFAAPIGVPLAITALILVFVALILFASCILCIFAISIASVFTGAVLTGAGFSLLASYPAGFCIMMGTGLLGIGFGILFFIASIYLCKWIGIGILRLIRKLL